MRFRIFYLVLLVAAFVAAIVAQSKPAIKNAPAGFSNSTSGQQMYLAYCASCHGQDGKGNGPAAPALKEQPTDLTQLAAKNNGALPASHIAEVVKGDAITAAHGSKEMPVWGPVFLYLEQHDPGMAQLRVRNLTNYIGSLQKK